MSPMDRRKFIKDMAIALAGTTAGLTANSCSLIKAGYISGEGDVDHEHTLKTFQQKSRDISTSPDMQRVEDYLESRDINRYMLKDSIISLMALSTFGDLKDRDQKHPAMQKMVSDSIPLMDRAIMSTITFLEGLSEKERTDIQATMNDHPEILTTFQVEFDKSARENDISPSSLDHFNALFNKSVWRLEQQDPSVFIDELTTLTDKTLDKATVTPNERRKLARNEGQPPPSMFNYQEQPTDSTGIKPSPEDLIRIQQYERWKKVAENGGNTLLWGLVQFGLGWALAASSDDWLEGIGAIGLFVGMTGGAIIAIVGIIMAIVGTVNMNKYE